MTFAVELAEKPGSVLLVTLPYARPDNWLLEQSMSVRPALVAQCIRKAISEGWTPNLPGPAHRLDLIRRPTSDVPPSSSGAKWTRTAGPPGPRTGSHGAAHKGGEPVEDSRDVPHSEPAAAADLTGLVGHTAGVTERVEAVEAFIDVASRLVAVGDLRWAEVEADFRLLAINVALRRQLESLRAAAMLTRQNFGHLAVVFVRASLEDVIYLSFFGSLTLEESQRLFLLLGNWDATRSLLAQRDYVGDDVMRMLWYPPAFLDAVQAKRDEVRLQLRELKKHYGWPGGDLPPGAWIAERAGQKDLYDYLHAATSRALHFSAGEIMRRGWGHPSGKMITDKPEFREHLASFALDQLWRLYVETWGAAGMLMEGAGISSDDTLDSADMEPVLSRLLTLGKVPLVHAHEWNLAPEGPLRFADPN
ncbi:DUF5677 domain-containing protein [Sphaerimonospora thailandensis]|nr:DUF5677 domain-containing protein [Sphaerimonospora thailandensis]